MSLGGARGLDVPFPVPQILQSQFVGQFACGHGVGQVLFVGEDQQDGLPQLVLGQHPHQLVAGLADALSVGKRSVDRDWAAAKAWLYCQLGEGADD